MANREHLLLELKEIEGKLDSIENEIECLLEKQQDMREKRDMLQTQLHSLDDDHVESTHQQSVDWETGHFPWTDDIHSTLPSKFHLNTFRPLQLSCINATLSKHDVILIMPTGGGKSLCYQLPAVVTMGFTLVISPLVSLMEDQLMSVKRLGIYSCMLNASSSREHVNKVLASLIDKKNQSLKLLYVTPEKISKSKRFMAKIEKAYEMGRLTRIVIDEVHCASQWGHDFRPDYKILGIIKRQFPAAPILGLTATATAKVLDDCKSLLNLQTCLVFKASYNRPNLFYEVRHKPSSHKEQVNEIVSLIKDNFLNQSGKNHFILAPFLYILPILFLCTCMSNF